MNRQQPIHHPLQTSARLFPRLGAAEVLMDRLVKLMTLLQALRETFVKAPAASHQPLVNRRGGSAGFFGAQIWRAGFYRG